MLPEIESQEFKDYIKDIFSGKHKHKYYDQTVELQREMGVHVSGDSPGDLIEKQRPNEPDDIKEYRKEIWQPITKPEYGKIQSVINRIFNPRYYSIQFKERPARVPENMTIDKYLLEDYPYYRSYLVFIQQVLLPKMLEDPNAICVIKPLNYDVKDIEEIQPIPQIYMSCKLLDFKPDVYYVIDTTDYENEKHRTTPKSIQLITGNYFMSFENGEPVDEMIEHKLGFTPVFRLGGKIIEDEYPYVYESFIAAVTAHWNKAVMIQSDLDAQIVLHAYLEKWEYQSVDCHECGGSGKERPPPGGYPKDYKPKTCSVCRGMGQVAKSPFQIYSINKDALAIGETPPTPPAGYIEKSIDIIEWMDTLVDKYIEKGFKAVNMDIVNQVGEVQSGIAKTIDRQDLDAFLMNISNHLFDYVIPNLIEYTIAWLYVSNDVIKKVDDYKYNIVKPARFDVMSISYLMDEFKMARDSGVDNTVLTGMQVSIIEKMFTGIERHKLIASIRLNPLTGMTDDNVLANRPLIGEEDQYIRIYIQDLLEEAIEKDGFLEKPLSEQKQIIREMARERIKQNRPALIERGEE